MLAGGGSLLVFIVSNETLAMHLYSTLKGYSIQVPLVVHVIETICARRKWEAGGHL